MSASRRARVGALAVFFGSLLTACGGGGDAAPAPTTLPATVTVQSTSQAQTDTEQTFATDLDAGLPGVTYQWSFGDGGTSNAARPSHRYAAPGSYEVTVTVRNAAGQSRSASYTVRVGFFDNVANRLCAGGTPGLGWCWQQPLPTGQQINDVQFLDAQNGWAVGEAGAVLRTRDGGTTWTRQASGVSVDLTQLRFTDATNGWITGAGNVVLQTRDGGATWNIRAVTYTSGYGATAFWALDAQRAVYSGNGTTYSTADAGVSWDAGTFTPTVVTPNGTWWALDGNGLRRSTDAGRTAVTAFTRPIQTYSVETFSFADDQHGLLLTREQVDPANYNDFVYAFWRTADGGNSWTRLSPVLTQPPFYYYGTSLFYGTGGEAWFTNGQSLWHSTDDGAHWVAVTLPAPMSFFTSPLAGAQDGHTLWFSSGNSAYQTHDGGATWRAYAVSAEAGPPRLREAGGTLWLSYDNLYTYSNARVYRSTDSGSTWQQVLGPDLQSLNQNLQALWFFNAQRGIAVSTDGTIMATTTGGQTWTRKSIAISNFSYYGARLQFQSDNVGWMLAGSSAIYKTTDGGASWWSPALSIALSGLTDFHFLDAQQGWAVDASGRVFHSTDGGQAWQQQASLPTSLTAVRFSTASTGVAVGQGGAIALTTDGGAHWQPRTAGVQQTLRRVVWSGTQVVWAVGDAGTVVRSADAGQTWSVVAVPASSSFYDIAFADAQHGWIVGDYGTALRTDDGGRTWVRQLTGTSRNLYSTFFRDASTGWLVGSGGAILATATGGQP